MVTVSLLPAGPTEAASLLPAAVFLLPIVTGAVIFALRGRAARAAEGIALATVAIMAGLACWITARVVGGDILTGWSNELRVDALSALLLLIVTFIGLAATVYSIGYFRHEAPLDRIGIGKAENRVAIYYALLVWCLGTMVWAVVTNNIIMLYVAVEATTLTTGLLVAFFWDRRALEAGYKYLMLLTVGITFALFGCVVMYAGGAATGKLAGREAVLISSLRSVAPLIPHRTALLATGLLLVGFGTKAGLAPFHAWLPDAHAEAPTPVSVLLSGVMIKVALYALARTVSVFYPEMPQITVFAVALGVFTMLLGVILALAQDDLKRLLAYSSVSQMGYVLAAVALGTYLGAFGGLFHLLNHAIFKSLLFMAAGAVMYATGRRRISELGGLARQMPVTSLCFVVGALAIAGFPPFNGFMSKFTIYVALADSGLWWAVALAVFTSLLTMVALLRPAYRVFWTEPAPSVLLEQTREVPATLWVPMLLLAGACLLLGVVPGIAHSLLDGAARLIATVVG